MYRVRVILLAAAAAAVSAHGGLRSGVGSGGQAMVPGSGPAPAPAPAPAVPVMGRSDITAALEGMLGDGILEPLDGLADRTVCDAFAVGAPSLGGIIKTSCVMGKTTRPMTLYRAYSVDANKARPIGAYWGAQDIMTNPPATTADYKHDMGICNEWNDADMLIKCTFPAGVTMSVGQTESAKCPDGTALPRTDSVHIFLDTFGELKPLADAINRQPKSIVDNPGGQVEVDVPHLMHHVECTRAEWQ